MKTQHSIQNEYHLYVLNFSFYLKKQEIDTPVSNTTKHCEISVRLTKTNKAL